MSRAGVSAPALTGMCRLDAKGGEASSTWFNSADRVPEAIVRDLRDLYKTSSRTSFLVAYTIGPLVISDVTGHLDISRLRERAGEEPRRRVANAYTRSEHRAEEGEQ